MKKIVIAMVLMGGMTISAHAQKYMTRTGKVSFFSSTPVENIEAFNNEVASIVDAGSGEMVFQVPVKSFKFEKALMQEHFNENYMESNKYPKAEFKGKIANMKDINFAKDGRYNARATGKLTMHGVTRDVTVPGTITVKDGNITLNSKFDVRPADYKIEIPKVVEGKIAEEIEVTVNSILNKR